MDEELEVKLDDGFDDSAIRSSKVNGKIRSKH